jgi:hypothetical protein
MSFNNVPVEIARSVVGGCESGNGTPGSGRQFEKDNKTPTKNRKGSSAFGIYQFLEEHRKPALDLGFDLNTKEGQDGYFAYRFSLYGMKDWEADPDSQSCWQSKLAAMGYGVDGNVRRADNSVRTTFVPQSFGNGNAIGNLTRRVENFGRDFRPRLEASDNRSLQIVTAPVDNWSKFVPPPSFRFVSVTIDDGAKDTLKYRVRWNGMIEEDFPIEKGSKSKLQAFLEEGRIFRGLELRSLEAESLMLKVKFD